MRNSAHARLLKLQRRIYHALEREAELLVGEPPASIRAYQARAERDFKGRFRHSTKQELIGEIRRHDVSLIADYHTFGQAQRTALRLMREAVLPGERWALGLELIPSHRQRALDDYQAGRISERKFHELIRYREDWGFPWKNYEPLFAWAREHDVRLIALNRPHELVYRGFAARQSDKSGRDLHARDQWAAGVITDLIAAEPGLRMLVLYGGHHVGRAHLPEQLARVSKAFLRRPLTTLSVHQNHAPLYWRLARKQRELHAQVLRLDSSSYCVFSGTPWAQLQSLIGSAEGQDLEDSQGEGGSDGTDYLSLMSAYGSVIAEFMGLKPGSFASLTVRGIEEADFVDALGSELPADEARLVRELIALNERFYLPREQIAYLASPSTNAAAEYAAIHLLRQHTRGRVFFRAERDDFFRLALESCFGFLGSLVLNPRRKCDLPKDHERRLRALSRGAREAYRGERRARELALALLSPRGRALALNARISRDSAAIVIGARYAGQVLAKRLHSRMLAMRHGGTQFATVVGSLTTRRSAHKASYERACEQLRKLGLTSRGATRGRARQTDSKGEQI